MSHITNKALYDKDIHNFCSEFYTVEKTIEVVVSRAGTPTTVKIEALKDEENGQYSVSVSRQEHLTIQPTYPQNDSKFSRKPDDFIVWVSWVDFPWVQRESADGALAQALGFLRERCDQS